MPYRQYRTFTLGILIGLSVSLTAIAAKPAVPKAVQVAIAKLFDGNKVEVEVEDGKYEVATTTTLEVVLAVHGGVEEIEVKLPIGLVPAPVIAAAKAALPAGARLEEAELLIRGSVLLYEIEARAALGEVELVLDGAGKVISQAAEQNDDDDDQ